MGLFKLVVYPIAFMGSCTWYAFALGSQLPVASRNAGRALGMGFNYFKVALKFFTPSSEEANKIVSQYRKGSQQAHAFTREFRQSVVSQKSQLKKIVPEFGEDPFKALNDLVDDPFELKKGKDKLDSNSGSLLLQ